MGLIIKEDKVNLGDEDGGKGEGEEGFGKVLVLMGVEVKGCRWEEGGVEFLNENIVEMGKGDDLVLRKGGFVGGVKVLRRKRYVIRRYEREYYFV